MTKIGIVILNYKTYLDTERLTQELLSQTSKDIEIMIQLVDNYSPNESYDHLCKTFFHEDRVCVIQNDSNAGFARGNNLGLRLLKNYNPDYALVLNNDVHFDLFVLNHLVDIYDELDSPGVISPLQRMPNGELTRFHNLSCHTFLRDLVVYTWILNKCLRFLEYKSNTKNPIVQEVDIIPGCFMFIKYDLFEQMGFFDEETFLFCEERFLYKKIAERGRHNYLILDCSYIHEHSKTINSEFALLGQMKLLKDGHEAFTRKYRSFPNVKIAIINLMWQYYKIGFHVKNYLKHIIKG